MELGFLSCLPGDIDRLFAAFDKDGSGDISFKELHRMLRKTVVLPPPRSLGGPAIDPIDLITLRQQTKQQVLTMSMQAELHNFSLMDDLTGEVRTGVLGVLPGGGGGKVAVDEHDQPFGVDRDQMAAAEASFVNEQLINAMEQATGLDIDGDGDVGALS